MSDDHGDDRVATAAAAIDRVERCKHIRGRHPRRADALQLGGKHVEQHLRVRSGVQMTPIFAGDDLGQLLRIGQVAVMGKTDSIGCIDIEGLRLGGAVTSGGGIAHVADTIVATQFEHMVLLKNIPHQATALAGVQLTLHRGRDTRRVLPAVLKHGQRIIDALIDRAIADDTYDAAHCRLSSPHDALMRVAFTPTPCRDSRRDARCGMRCSPTMVRRPLATVSP
jgi:hypothetical protein